MKAKNIIFVVIMATIGAIGVVHAIPGAGHHAQKLRQVFEVLELTDEQKKQVRAIFQERRPQMQELREQRKAFHVQIDDMMQADTFDEASFRELWNQNREMFEQAAIARAKTRFEVRAILNEEQQEKLDLIKALRGPLHRPEHG